jgi:hypothetical protein
MKINCGRDVTTNNEMIITTFNRWKISKEEG